MGNWLNFTRNWTSTRGATAAISVALSQADGTIKGVPHYSVHRRTRTSVGAAVESLGPDPANQTSRGQFGVSPLCRLAAPGMMKMELGFGSLWLEAGVG